MPRYAVPLHIEIEAEDSDAAFAYVRSHYCVVDDPKGEVKNNLVKFEIGEEPTELADDEFVIN